MSGDRVAVEKVGAVWDWILRAGGGEAVRHVQTSHGQGPGAAQYARHEGFCGGAG